MIRLVRVESKSFAVPPPSYRFHSEKPRPFHFVCKNSAFDVVVTSPFTLSMDNLNATLLMCRTNDGSAENARELGELFRDTEPPVVVRGISETDDSESSSGDGTFRYTISLIISVLSTRVGKAPLYVRLSMADKKVPVMVDVGPILCVSKPYIAQKATKVDPSTSAVKSEPGADVSETRRKRRRSAPEAISTSSSDPLVKRRRGRPPKAETETLRTVKDIQRVVSKIDNCDVLDAVAELRDDFIKQMGELAETLETVKQMCASDDTPAYGGLFNVPPSTVSSSTQPPPFTPRSYDRPYTGLFVEDETNPFAI